MVKEFLFAVENACRRCCRVSINETCSPVEPPDILADGTPCIQGFCNKVGGDDVIFTIITSRIYRATVKKPFKTLWNVSGT